MRFKVKSQLFSDSEAIKQHIYDDCGPSSTAAAIAWASNYKLDPSATDGVNAKSKATGFKEKEGVSDNGSSLNELVKTAVVLGGRARFATSWEDVAKAAKAGAGLLIWVQQAKGYPATVDISQWHRNWVKYWMKNDPTGKTVTTGYGHMTAAAWCADHGWQWACPTRSGKGSEQYADLVTENELRQIARSKGGEDYKHVLIVTVNKTGIAPAINSTTTADASLAYGAENPGQDKSIITDEVDAQLIAIEHADWGNILPEAFHLIQDAEKASESESTVFGKIAAIARYIVDNSQLDEMLLDAIRTFLTVAISVALGLGIPLLDISGGDFRTVVSAGLASALGVIVKFLDPQNSSYGIRKS